MDVENFTKDFRHSGTLIISLPCDVFMVLRRSNWSNLWFWSKASCPLFANPLIKDKPLLSSCVDI